TLNIQVALPERSDVPLSHVLAMARFRGGLALCAAYGPDHKGDADERTSFPYFVDLRDEVTRPIRVPEISTYQTCATSPDGKLMLFGSNNGIERVVLFDGEKKQII